MGVNTGEISHGGHDPGELSSDLQVGGTEPPDLEDFSGQQRGRRTPGPRQAVDVDILHDQQTAGLDELG